MVTSPKWRCLDPISRVLAVPSLHPPNTREFGGEIIHFILTIKVKHPFIRSFESWVHTWKTKKPLMVPSLLFCLSSFKITNGWELTCVPYKSHVAPQIIMVRQYLQMGLRVSLNHKYIFALCTALQVPSYDFANSFPVHVVNSAPHSLRSTYRFIRLDAAWDVSSLGLLLALSSLLYLCLFVFLQWISKSGKKRSYDIHS